MGRGGRKRRETKAQTKRNEEEEEKIKKKNRNFILCTWIKSEKTNRTHRCVCVISPARRMLGNPPKMPHDIKRLRWMDLWTDGYILYYINIVKSARRGCVMLWLNFKSIQNGAERPRICIMTGQRERELEKQKKYIKLNSRKKYKKETKRNKSFKKNENKK